MVSRWYLVNELPEVETDNAMSPGDVDPRTRTLH
jgi:hypothetical protein